MRTTPPTTHSIPATRQSKLILHFALDMKACILKLAESTRFADVFSAYELDLVKTIEHSASEHDCYLLSGLLWRLCKQGHGKIIFLSLYIRHLADAMDIYNFHVKAIQGITIPHIQKMVLFFHQSMSWQLIPWLGTPGNDMVCMLLKISINANYRDIETKPAPIEDLNTCFFSGDLDLFDKLITTNPRDLFDHLDSGPATITLTLTSNPALVERLFTTIQQASTLSVTEKERITNKVIILLAKMTIDFARITAMTDSPSTQLNWRLRYEYCRDTLLQIFQQYPKENFASKLFTTDIETFTQLIQLKDISILVNCFILMEDRIAELVAVHLKALSSEEERKITEISNNIEMPQDECSMRTQQLLDKSTFDQQALIEHLVLYNYQDKVHHEPTLLTFALSFGMSTLATWLLYQQYDNPTFYEKCLDDCISGWMELGKYQHILAVFQNTHPEVIHSVVRFLAREDTSTESPGLYKIFALMPKMYIDYAEEISAVASILPSIKRFLNHAVNIWKGLQHIKNQHLFDKTISPEFHLSNSEKKWLKAFALIENKFIQHCLEQDQSDLLRQHADSQLIWPWKITKKSGSAKEKKHYKFTFLTRPLLDIHTAQDFIKLYQAAKRSENTEVLHWLDTSMTEMLKKGETTLANQQLLLKALEEIDDPTDAPAVLLEHQQPKNTAQRKEQQRFLEKLAREIEAMGSAPSKGRESPPLLIESKEEYVDKPTPSPSDEVETILAIVEAAERQEALQALALEAAAKSAAEEIPKAAEATAAAAPAASEATDTDSDEEKDPAVTAAYEARLAAARIPARPTTTTPPAAATPAATPDKPTTIEAAGDTARRTVKKGKPAARSRKKRTKKKQPPQRLNKIAVKTEYSDLKARESKKPAAVESTPRQPSAARGPSREPQSEQKPFRVVVIDRRAASDAPTEADRASHKKQSTVIDIFSRLEDAFDARILVGDIHRIQRYFRDYKRAILNLNTLNMGSSSLLQRHALQVKRGFELKLKLITHSCFDETIIAPCPTKTYSLQNLAKFSSLSDLDGINSDAIDRSMVRLFQQHIFMLNELELLLIKELQLLSTKLDRSEDEKNLTALTNILANHLYFSPSFCDRHIALMKIALILRLANLELFEAGTSIIWPDLAEDIDLVLAPTKRGPMQWTHVTLQETLRKFDMSLSDIRPYHYSGHDITSIYAGKLHINGKPFADITVYLQPMTGKHLAFELGRRLLNVSACLRSLASGLCMVPPNSISSLQRKEVRQTGFSSAENTLKLKVAMKTNFAPGWELDAATKRFVVQLYHPSIEQITFKEVWWLFMQATSLRRIIHLHSFIFPALDKLLTDCGLPAAPDVPKTQFSLQHGQRMLGFKRDAKQIARIREARTGSKREPFNITGQYRVWYYIATAGLIDRIRYIAAVATWPALAVDGYPVIACHEYIQRFIHHPKLAIPEPTVFLLLLTSWVTGQPFDYRHHPDAASLSEFMGVLSL